jgi:hypothetical protein
MMTSELAEGYGRHKGDFAIGRYEELKAMIKSAVQQLNAVTDDNRNNRATVTPSNGGGGKGLAERMRSSAAKFSQSPSGAGGTETLSGDEKLYAS